VNRIKLLLIVLAALLVTACGAFKPIVRTLDDVARFHCAQHVSGARGVSLEDAWEAYCKTREAWSPWIDPVIRAQAEGVEIAESQNDGAAGEAGAAGE
jgi:hypothetical protein